MDLRRTFGAVSLVFLLDCAPSQPVRPEYVGPYISGAQIWGRTNNVIFITPEQVCPPEDYERPKVDELGRLYLCI